jgi:VIT1/CCC1 family predicted Fe2+/Mn2+ transporter
MKKIIKQQSTILEEAWRTDKGDFAEQVAAVVLMLAVTLFVVFVLVTCLVFYTKAALFVLIIIALIALFITALTLYGKHIKANEDL